jgi:hypothetical protein
MAGEPSLPPPSSSSPLSLVERKPGLRALAWAGDVLYASRGYQVLRGSIRSGRFSWEPVARFRPAAWRALTSANRLASRLLRDGFHALAVLPSGRLVGAVPGAIVTFAPGDLAFRITHRVTRGTRPLHITATPQGHLFWGEYFDNPERDEVQVYGSRDHGETWQVEYTFPKRTIRHVHHIAYDPWENCLWILTGDNGQECRILRSSCDLQTMDVALSGNQQARAVALVPSQDGLYFSSDTPFEKNHVYHLDRAGNLSALCDLPSSSIYGCQVADSVFFTTMAEPSATNETRAVHLYGEIDGRWRSLVKWKKDLWAMRFFQYGNAVLPDGHNRTAYLAVSTVAVERDDLTTTILRLG